MLLAEKGLPTSANAGYELFDNVGSLGLTSFMQQMTRVRALEGEIARTIQSIQGIKAARVHIVMAERANFRRDEQKPSASVVIRASDIDAGAGAMSIRYLVAAAVPGLNVDKVTVLDSSGTLLAAGDDPNNTSASRSIGVERTVETRSRTISAGADALSRPRQFPRQRQGRGQHRHPPDRRDDLRSGIARRAVGAGVRANENNSQKRRSSAASGRPEPAARRRRAPTARELRDVVGKRPQGGNDQLRDELQAHRHRQQRLLGDQDVDLGRRQPEPARRDPRQGRDAGRGRAPASPRSRRSSLRRPASASRAATHQRLGGRIHRRARRRRVDRRASSTRSAAQAGTMINAAGLRRRRLPASPGSGCGRWWRRWSAGRARTARAELRGRAALAADAGPGGHGDRRRCRRADGRSGARQNANALDDLRQKIRPAPQDRLARMVDLNEERSAQILRKWGRHGEAQMA